MNLTVFMVFLVPIILIFVLLVFILLTRYIRFRERVALAQLGFSLEEIKHHSDSSRGSRGVLWGGVITAMSGLALLLGLGTLGTGVWLIAGLLPLFVGLGMMMIYIMTYESGDAGRRVASDRGTSDESLDLDAEEDALEPFDDLASQFQDEPQAEGRSSGDAS